MEGVFGGCCSRRIRLIRLEDPSVDRPVKTPMPLAIHCMSLIHILGDFLTPQLSYTSPAYTQCVFAFPALQRCATVLYVLSSRPSLESF